jgi:RNA polymerase sigma-70 factor (ECF subfamily)
MDCVEKELLSRMKLDDITAFTEIYKRYQHLLHLEAYYKLNHHEEAQDLVQEVFVSLWSRRKELLITQSLKAYLMRSVHNLYANVVRSKISFRKYLSNCPQPKLEDSNSIFLEHKEFHYHLYNAIGRISAKTCRLITQKVLLDQWSYTEIQDEFKVSPANARNQVSRGIKELKTFFLNPEL